MPVTVTTTIIVPCYNEANRLENDTFLEFSVEHPNIHFVFIDDGSTDHTSSLIEALCNLSPKNFKLITLARNQGKAGAVRQGVLSAINTDSNYIGYWDADLSTPLSEIPRLQEALDISNLDFVIGSRIKMLGYEIDRHLIRYVAGRIFATAASRSLSLPVYDTQCGAKLFRNNKKLQTAFAEPFITNWAFDIELIRRFSLLNEPLSANTDMLDIEEVPLRKWRDIPGSKVKYYDLFIGLYEVIKIYRYYNQPEIRSYYLSLTGS